MKRSKAEFRALRETLGITQQSLADRLGVKILSVKRWEMPKYPQQAPERVWAILDDLLAAQSEEVASATESAEGTATLHYWMSAQDFEDLADEHEHGSTWTEANATRRAIAQSLRAKGVHIDWKNAAG